MNEDSVTFMTFQTEPSNRLCIPSEQLKLVAELAIFCEFILEDGEQE